MKLKTLKSTLPILNTSRVKVLDTKAGATPRIRGKWLQRFRARHFNRHPLCVTCEAAGRIELATELDHVVALVNGGKDFDKDPGNAQGLCSTCHEDKTRLDLGQQVKKQVGLDGWPIE